MAANLAAITHGFAMATARIAVLFDAENVNCETARRVLRKLAELGTVPIRRAVGDFSAANLAKWIECGRDNGIELVLQPGLGKGKNGADIRLTIEAMDIAYQGHIDTVALVTHDRDFAPLAMRLRHAHLAVLGFAQAEPHPAFRQACSAFVVVGKLAPTVVAQPAPVKTVPAKSPLDKSEVTRLGRVARHASADGPISPQALTRAVIAAEPDLATRLSGKASFLKTLVAHGIVERVGNGAGLLVQAPRL